MPLYINTRTLSNPLTGVQRYTSEIINRFRGDFKNIEPLKPSNGVKGHLWEQFILPQLIGNMPLWSPSNTGPLKVKNQVVTIHDVVPFDHPEWLNYKFARWYCWLIPKLIKKIPHIISVSEFTKDRLITLFNIKPEKISVIHNGVSSYFRPLSKKDIQSVNQKLNLPSSEYFLSLSSLEPRKNLPSLLKAWMIIKDKIPKNTWLIIAGEKGNPLVFNKLNLNFNIPRVFFTGRIDDKDLPALYGGAIAFIYLSSYEGFGLPPLEAMACGTPVIVGNKTALPEIVENSGILINPNDIEEISFNIKKIADDLTLHKKLKEMGLNRSSLFTWEKSSIKTWETLQNVFL